MERFDLYMPLLLLERILVVILAPLHPPHLHHRFGHGQLSAALFLFLWALVVVTLRGFWRHHRTLHGCFLIVQLGDFGEYVFSARNNDDIDNTELYIISHFNRANRYLSSLGGSPLDQPSLQDHPSRGSLSMSTIAGHCLDPSIRCQIQAKKLMGR